ncbi:hypothetical protein A0H81_01442 [Grifola frondosa]|uniref:Uncharacterized protein n=1 Tax=Grifola frondosa TaxID=5627 RepID=A0A1C7MQB9_GRIFR|nr:hypothetical protein A0H81_01442 [Grifola frondosa]
MPRSTHRWIYQGSPETRPAVRIYSSQGGAPVAPSDGTPVQVNAGDIVSLALKKAYANPADFPEPQTVNPRRPSQSYQALLDASFYSCLGVAAAEKIVVEMVKAVFRLKNIRRAAVLSAPCRVCLSRNLASKEICIPMAQEMLVCGRTLCRLYTILKQCRPSHADVLVF